MNQLFNNISCRFNNCVCLIAFFLFVVTPSLLIASPRLITDNRVENLNGFPSIGRGYNLHSNTLQSMCYNKVLKTKPTFDLNYEMDEVSVDFFNQVPEIGKKRLGNINIHFFVKKYFKSREIDSQQTYNLKNLLVRVEIRSYYYALDETKSVISDSAKRLLKNKEFVTFFNSCGQHYVRSVGSFSTYLALLQYRLTGNSTADQAFVSRLEKGLFNFSGENTAQKKLNQDAEARGMRVYVQAVGLSKGNLVNLIPVDVKQFRLTVQDTVKLMQDPNAGLISYIEVVPWVENPELTSFITSGMQQGGEQFIKLQRLEANSGVITEINRISNSQIEQFYIASMCEKILFENYMDKTNRQFYENITGQAKKSPTVLQLTDIIAQKTLSYDMERTLFYNLANISKDDVYISLREFIEYFAKNPPRKLFEENRDYLYGTGGKEGAVQCIDELYKQGLEKTDYRTIPSCVNALKHIKTQSFFLNQYCLPKPAKLVFKGDEVTPAAEPKKPIIIDDDLLELDEKPTAPAKGEKPKSLDELMGGKPKSGEGSQKNTETEKNKSLETDKAEGPTSLDDLMDGDEVHGQGATQPLFEEDGEKPSSIILKELEEGEIEAKKTPAKLKLQSVGEPVKKRETAPVRKLPTEDKVKKVEGEEVLKADDQLLLLKQTDEQILKQDFEDTQRMSPEGTIKTETEEILKVEE